MIIYLVCKHRRFRDNYGSGIYLDFTIYYSTTWKSLAQSTAKQLNSRSQKYFYKVKKIEISI